MKSLIEEIQAQIDELKTSKFGKLSDGQLLRQEKMSIPFPLIQEMHKKYIEQNLSLLHLGEMYNMSDRVIQKCFYRYKLETKSNAGFSKSILQEKIDDIQNGMSLADFMTKYNCSRNNYFHTKRKLNKCG